MRQTAAPLLLGAQPSEELLQLHNHRVVYARHEVTINKLKVDKDWYDRRVSDPPAAPHPLPDPLVELLAQRFRVLAEPMRIKLLDHLRDGEASVGQLQAALGASQQNLSKHLGILHAAGIVSRTKQGNRTLYAISDPTVFELCDHVCGGLRRQVAELDAILH
jgi:DNA-binding transcriptional ArsR family regulator